MRCFQIKYDDSGTTCVFAHNREGRMTIDAELDDMVVGGGALIIRVVDMSQEELDALPEFDGW